MPITSIIFSKDRPLQLDLCLSSMEKCDVNNIFEEKIVIYKCSNERYRRAYKELRKEHRDVSFWEQGKSLFNDVDVAVSCCLSPCVAFFTDDNIFYNDLCLSEDWLSSIFNHRLISHVSLRLGKNTQFRDDGSGKMLHQPVGSVTEWRNSTPHKSNAWEKTYIYDRSIHYYGGYWNYPISLDGHIFKQSTVQEWTEELCYLDKVKKWKQNPNELERALQRFCQECPPFVAIPPEGCVVNSPNNQVSDYWEHDPSENAAGQKYKIGADDLLEDFNAGYRVCYKMLKSCIGKVICPHQEINISDAMIKEIR